MLEAVCKGGGTQFYKIRQARRLYSQQSSRAEAFHQISEVIDVAMHKEDGLYRRATMYVRASQFNLARDDIGKLRDLGPEARRLADELDAVCLIGEGQFPEAKRFIETHFSGARSVAEQLERQLVRAISFSPSGLSTELVTWAKNYR